MPTPSAASERPRRSNDENNSVPDLSSSSAPKKAIAVADAEADEDQKPEPKDNAHAEIGVSRVEAFNKVLYQSGRAGQILLWLLAISISLTMFAYALDLGITTTVFNTMASSTFGKHSQLGAVATASQIIRAISKPFIGKLSDITSRPTTYVVILCFYVLGFIVAATSSTFAAYTVGVCFTAIGKSGLDLLSDIIVGDLTPLQWRGFFGAVLSLPFVVTVPINGFLGAAFVDRWRWGLGMFAIIMPVLLLPAIATLYVMQRRGEKVGMVTMAASRRLRHGTATEEEMYTQTTRFSRWIQLLGGGLIDIDIIGLVILGVSFSLILLPFSVAKDTAGGWHSPRIIAMLVVGFILLVAFVLYEHYLSPKPIMSQRIIKNRAFLAAVTIFTFNQMASSVRNTYLSSYVYIIKQWTEYEWIIFLGITTMGLSLLGPIVGLVQRHTHRYKSLMIFGAVAKILGYSLLLETNGTMTQGTGRLVAAQLIYCLSAFNVVGARVGSQASVPHEDMASMISLLTLWSTLGSSIGSAVASAIWTNEMLDRMHVELPNVNDKTLKKIFGSIKKLRTDYAYDDPIRQGAIRAYSHVNGHIAITALILSAPPLFATFFMPDFYLGKQQNAVTNTGLDGERVEVPESETRGRNADGSKAPFYRRWFPSRRTA
ncbi:hypothetical protein LMH87_004365 [Akanthomyces muscarius]|uniref:Major facilitator superfamily (MFS) profile domain-containing protein n=1 Tax=Akanthomyces muscarius TaxID=2231603 RepID=A0A9W8Q5H6_AKAMU|nr:hypothetical protein LMH87_004365 [Akanthomyces muscarius]KAJ4145517.1 hypothetical protein LMH87_004365 [Akanthomyces muscarius]